VPDWDDDELLAKRYAGEGNPVDLETLFRRHIKATYGFARRFLRTREDAEEAASEAWLRAFRALRADGFRGESRFATWVLGIVRLVCLERVRQPRLPTLSLSGIEENGRGDWVLFAPAPQPVSPVREAMADLSEDHRLIISLCDLQGLTSDEAAPVVGRSPAAAKSLLARARRALRDRMLAIEDEERTI
jgi:RNA polymerase sigma-70 factor (ECF subfamily)